MRSVLIENPSVGTTDEVLKVKRVTGGTGNWQNMGEARKVVSRE